MAYVIAEPCIGTKDRACVDACPVDCIHPKADEAGSDTADQLFIDPVECIDCGACVPVTFQKSGRASRKRTQRTSGGRKISKECLVLAL
jgi:NAD-dependent dihydropyrimidine dehydrogenase PreA subunit